ncbi:GrpB family protein [Streptomyces sp. PSKA28]|uniref:GrpB family protein n=1 Tax=Streptomyces himalayensis subsp. himalayensis TaxID=2756131 RepID=A0A7W0DN25_9ACTN|nr:GrpB family protein [Streptomyces himalayensis subsp. himalayensis]
MDEPVRVVEVVAYDPTWPEQFETERQLLADALPQAVSIEHIGSTSVPGLAAKPIIDIIAVVPDVKEVAADVSALERHGYVFRP